MPDSGTQLYTVGGTVTGLSGTGLKLTNNGETLDVSANGTFHFPTAVASGTAYAVTVSAQPSSPLQTCTVTGGTGSVGTSDVTSISVSCSNLYTVGGTITGLNGTVVIATGTQRVSRNVNGAFVFSGPFATGDSYDIKVVTAPATQDCTITHGTGSVGTADVTDVAVACVTHSYTVGGTVSGLASGDTVVLSNGTDTLSVVANGPFTMPGKVAQGSDYSVGVRTPPTGKLCSVSNGSGTMGGANVTNITVTCSANTYAVGGSVSGLGAGLTVKLLDNGGDEQTVSSNGPFTFATRVAEGGSYSVTVSAQPAGQRCTVANGSGTNLMADVTNVAVTCVSLYTVGGSVTGLASGKSVVLTNNGGDDLTVGGTSSGSAAFTFATSVASGSAYLVSVKTAPTGTTCAVTNGSGTIGSANVTNVSVTCTVDKYTVGGTVSGLGSGKSVVLTDNGGDDLAVSGTSGGTASFTFATSVASGSAYLVAVKTQPSGATCAVSNGSGTVGTTNVTSVTVTCTPNKYTVGGTVNGLSSGKSVVLTDNGGDDLTVSGTSGGTASFTFATSVASGSAYLVAVKTQPSGFTCTVSNGSGTVGAANVADVSVSCTPLSYTVGGSVSGLSSGKSVVLTDNGGDDLTVSGTSGGTASFTFATSVASGSAYLVAVKTQPSGLTCTVSNGSGTIAASNVTNVTVTCGTTTYTVGGTASGLVSGKTLVLTNNGGDDLTVSGTSSGNATFTFATGLASGSTYAVAVKTQPSGYTCSVSGGSGTVGTSNVTSVSVFCSVTKYSVGGNVTGLVSGKTLVLTNNGGDDLTVNGSSGSVPFTFATSLTSGSAYAVAVKTQPSGYTCTVDSATGSGTVGTSNVTNVAVACVAVAMTKVVVLQVGDGSALSGAAAPVALLTFDVAGGTASSPTSTVSVTGLTISGSSGSEGFLSRAADAHSVVFAGYSAAAGTVSVAMTTAAATPRVVGRLDSAGGFSIAATLNAAFSGSNVRSAASDGTNYWVSGTSPTSGTGSGTGGVHYVISGSTGASTQIVSNPDNSRVVNIFNGQLYLSSGSGTFKTVSAVGTGTPTTSGQTPTPLSGLPNGTSPITSPYQFFFLNSSTLYVADDTAGISKYTKDGSGNWSTATITNPGGADAVVALTDGTSTRLVVVLRGSANKLVTFLDDGTTTATTVTITTAGTGYAFRGIALAPIP